jgi:hypothetical protein
VSRKLIENQLVTYKKKLVSNKKETTNKWWSIFKSLLITVALVALTVATDGIGAAAAGAMGLAEGLGSVVAFGIDTAIQFTINEGMDALTGNINLSNTLQNLAFSAIDIGRIGRGFKNQKLLKIAKELKLFDEAKIAEKIRNFYDLSKALSMKDIVVGGTKLAFGRKIVESELIEAINSLATNAFKKELKTLTNDEVKLFLELQKTIRKINPKLVENFSEFKKNFDFEKHFDMNVDEFIKLSNDEAIGKILEKDFAESTMEKLFSIREEAKFQEEFIQVFKRFKDKWKSRLDKINPKKYVSKIIEKILEKPKAFITKIEMKTKSFLEKLGKKELTVIEKYSLIPCREESMFVGFRFEPSSISGEGYIMLYKRDHINMDGSVSKYNVVRAWTNQVTVETFAVSQHQNRFYLYESGWALGWGFTQKQFKFLSLISPRVSAVINKVRKIYTTVLEVYIVASTLTSVSAGNISNKLKNFTINKALSTLRLSKFKGLFEDTIDGNFNDFLYDFTKIGANFISHSIIKHIRRLK